jgi:hypothetical protein
VRHDRDGHVTHRCQAAAGSLVIALNVVGRLVPISCYLAMHGLPDLQ